ncbi:unnamed protein product [marine sediment metagenome]|uniref:Peptidase M15A C-terminal domain-containing protein n=1 Tax=marine sediment metagenome TaxID=412755 RepID=X0U777_9ZZZZ
MKLTDAHLMINKICGKQYFVFSELKCKCGCGFCNVDYDALKMLVKARVILGKPIILNSAYRCERHNAVVGSTTNNHTSGVAFDIRCENGAYRLKLIEALLMTGFERIVVYPDFIHVDNNLNYSKGLWLKIKSKKNE